MFNVYVFHNPHDYSLNMYYLSNFCTNIDVERIKGSYEELALQEHLCKDKTQKKY